MAEERQTAAVSRSEFYGTLSIVWTYIMPGAVNQLGEKATVSKWLLFAGAFGMGLAMTVLSVRSRAGKTGGA
jgi:hypothetical protein